MYEKVKKSEGFCDRIGTVISISESYVHGSGLEVSIGNIVSITTEKSSVVVSAEVVHVDQHKFVLMPIGGVHSIKLNSKIFLDSSAITIPVGNELKGRVFDAFSQPLDGLPHPVTQTTVHRDFLPINPLHRPSITTVLPTNISSIDIFTPLGRGQRIGIFAGSGVGKSTLLGMLCRYVEADVVIVAMIGERGREVNDFLQSNIFPESRRKTIMYIATAEHPAILRRQVAFTATLVAEWFRTQGQHVLLVMDSITRFAYAQREIGLAAGEPIGSRGYPPSTFSLLPQLVERAGLISGQGSITGVYTVLVEGDDTNEPISDHLRSILDGHILLDRRLAEQGHLPAIDVLKSISRLSGSLLNENQKTLARKLRQALKIYEESADLILLGAYQKGANPRLDMVLEHLDEIKNLLIQTSSEKRNLPQTWQRASLLVAKMSGDL